MNAGGGAARREAPRMEWTTQLVAPAERDLSERYRELGARIETGEAGAWRSAFDGWDAVRREWKSWANLVRLRYTQDTRSDEARETQRELDRRTPGVTALETAMKRRFLGGARPALEDDIGAQAFALWDADVTTFDERIATDLVREAELARSYTELLATAEVEFEGERRSLGGLGVFLQAGDRDVRHAAERARWSAFEERAERLDAIFDELVRLRDGMARKLGYANFTELGYRRMRRVDYGPADVARYREEVERPSSCPSHTIWFAGSAPRRDSNASRCGMRRRSPCTRRSNRAATALGSSRARGRRWRRSIRRSARSSR